jgi:hypothetical protein
MKVGMDLIYWLLLLIPALLGWVCLVIERRMLRRSNSPRTPAPDRR